MGKVAGSSKINSTSSVTDALPVVPVKIPRVVISRQNYLAEFVRKTWRERRKISLSLFLSPAKRQSAGAAPADAAAAAVAAAELTGRRTRETLSARRCIVISARSTPRAGRVLGEEDASAFVRIDLLLSFFLLISFLFRIKFFAIYVDAMQNEVFEKTEIDD